MKRPATFAALRDPSFRWLWLGQTVSTFGDRVFLVAIALALVVESRSGAALGWALAAASVGELLFILPSGILADRRRRVSVLIGADLLRAVAVTVLALLDARSRAQLAPALTFLMGAGDALFAPAYGALVPALVSRDSLQSASSLTSLSARIAMIAGPGAAGLLVVLTGARGALLFDAATFAVSLLTLLRVREPRAGEREELPLLSDALAGVREVRRRPWVAGIILVGAAGMMLTIAPWQVLLPVVSERSLGGAGAYSLVVSLFGVGALAAALVGGTLPAARRGLVALAGLWLFALPLAGLAIPLPAVAIGGLALFAGAGFQVFGILSESAVQREVPPAAIAKVTALEHFASGLAFPIGLALTGPLVSVLGVRPVLAVAAAALPVITLAVLPLRGTATFGTGAEDATSTTQRRAEGRGVIG